MKCYASENRAVATARRLSSAAGATSRRAMRRASRQVHEEDMWEEGWGVSVAKVCKSALCVKVEWCLLRAQS